MDSGLLDPWTFCGTILTFLRLNGRTPREGACAVSDLHVGVAGADVSPRFHPEFGAWGTSPTLPELDLPLLARCVVLRQDGRTVVWYGIDLITLNVPQTDELRAELAAALRLEPEQIVLSTSQVHSSGAFPGSNLTGCAFVDDARRDAAFADAERKRFMALLVDAGREALEQVQPAPYRGAPKR